MGLAFEDREIEGITIVDLHGRLIAGDEVSKFDAQMDEMLWFGKKNVILNLQRVSTIDSTGLGMLVTKHRVFEQATGALKLLRLSKRHAELFVLTKLWTIFQIFEDEKAAIDSFFPDREVPHFDILEFVKSEEARQGQAGDGAGEQKSES